jgi:hypothetical protein
LIAVIISIFLCLICGVAVGGVVLVAVIISIFCRSYLWCYSRPPTVTPQIRPTKNTNDYSNQDHVTYCNTTNKACKTY